MKYGIDICSYHGNPNCYKKKSNYVGVVLMKTSTYTVTGKSGANLRLLPSTASDILETIPPGTKVDVVDKITASNTNGTQTVYLFVNCSGRYG